MNKKATNVTKTQYQTWVVGILRELDDMWHDAILKSGELGIARDWDTMRIYRNEASARAAARRIFNYSSLADISQGSWAGFVTWEQSQVAVIEQAVKVNDFELDTANLSGEQKQVIERINATYRKAWERTDKRLTKVHAGSYVARKGDLLINVYRHVNGIDWMYEELAVFNSTCVWEGNLSDFRELVNQPEIDPIGRIVADEWNC